MKIAHLTDLHFTVDPHDRYPTSAQAVAATIDDLNRQDLDAIIITGDLLDHPGLVGRDAPALARELARLTVPPCLVVGNHDVAGPATQARKRRLAEILPGLGTTLEGRLCRTVALTERLHLVLLDSTDNGSADYQGWTGRFSEEQAQWLEETLQGLEGQDVLLAIHHSPVLPSRLFASLRFEEADARRLHKVVVRHRNIVAILCGHLHVNRRMAFAGIPVLCAPGLVEYPHHYRLLQVEPGPRELVYGTRMAPSTEGLAALRPDRPAQWRRRILRPFARGTAGHVYF